MRQTILLSLLCSLGVAACTDSGPGRAGIVTKDNAEQVLPDGDVVAGAPGDYFLRNSLATFIIQRPGRELALGPYGGSLVDIALKGCRDRFGELIPALAFGRTVRVDSIDVIADGSDGGPAIVEARGEDATNVYYNIEGLDPSLFEDLGILQHDPDDPLELGVRIRYTLPADEARLSIAYTFENRAPIEQPISLGLLIDARGKSEAFQPGTGFTPGITKSFSEDNISALLELNAVTSQLLFIDKEATVAVLPRRLGGRPVEFIGVQVPILGSIVIFGARSLISSLSSPALRLEPGESTTLEVDVLLAETAAQALLRGREILGMELAPVSGCVHWQDGRAAAGVRVGLMDSERLVTATFETADDGCFTGRVPPGLHTAVAGRLYFPPSEEEIVNVPGTVTLSLPNPGTLGLDIDTLDRLDSSDAQRLPCKVVLVGERSTLSHPALGEDAAEHPGNVVYRQRFLRTCRDEMELPPGRYLAFVMHGPEFDRIEQLIDVEQGERTEIRGRLRRVVDSQGFAASDFHVHAIFSPDSMVAADDRVLSIAAAGLDFWASTEHDVVVDFDFAIQRNGLGDQLLTVPGSEVTTFDTGHFGAYPLPVNDSLSSGGAPDWAWGEGDTRPSMQVLFDRIHRLGALVQVNHPRSGGMALGAYFTRAGLVYDPLTREPFADPQKQPIGNESLRQAPGRVYFSPDFEVIEVLNGIRTYVHDGMVYDRAAEKTGHDWMNFISLGRPIVGVGNSDTHSLATPPGTPRTMVGGHAEGVSGIMRELRRGNAVMTTGPMVRATLIDAAGHVAGVGDQLAPVSALLTLRVQVETPTWYRVNALEVIANAFFSDPTDDTLPTRALPLAALAPEEVERPNGGKALVVVAELQIDLNEAPFAGEDSWLIVRIGGTDSVLYPVHGGGGTIDPSGETPEAFLKERQGPQPYAMTNPIYIDADGDGIWRRKP